MTGLAVVVSGRVEGMGMGAELTPWVRVTAAGGFERGKATVLVSLEGTFTWERRMPRGGSDYFEGAGARSNTVVIR